MNKNIRIIILILLASVAVLLASCEMPSTPARTNVWIDVPVDGITVPEGTMLQIEGHASSQGGVTRIEIWIDGVLQFEVADPDTVNDLSRFSQEWTPPGPGEYTIQVLAIGGDGSSSEPDNARVQVGAPIAELQLVPEEQPAADEPTPTFTPTPTPSPTPPPATEVVIDFWADPGEINAGGKFTVHWHVENVREVIFGGMEQPFDGSYSDYLCENQRYTLTVIHSDGSEEKRSVDIRVNGQCEAPEDESSQPENSSGGEAPAPAADTTPPAVPTQLKPLNGADMGCISSTILRWQAVSDDSEISEYQVEMQRHSGDNNWQAAPGSIYTGMGGLEKNISVECGWEYRWRVRAIDGAGNPGNWSGWFTFVIPLT